MKTNILGIAVGCLLATIIGLAPMQGLAQEKKKEDPATAEKKSPPKGEKQAGQVPFRGKLVAVDRQAKTIKVGERTFQITSESKLSKAGKPATLDDAVVGDEVGGSYQKNADGTLSAKLVRFGSKAEGETKAKAKKEQ
jgi:hypothetical protein